ncbi:MAG: DnaA/Hda family protein, partial [Candidatus Delongbacteria bacterium]
MFDINKTENLFKDKIKGFLNQNSFNTWIKPIKIVNIENDTVSFQVPSKIHIDYIKGQYKSVFEKTLGDILGNENSVLKFLIDAETDFNLDQKQKEHTVIQTSRKSSKNRLGPYKETSLNPKYTFDNFVMGNGNETAYVSSMQVAKNIKNTQYNPLLIFGGVGLGKTHLVSAIGNYVFNHNTSLKVIYLTSDQFVTQMFFHIKNKTIDTYKQFLSSKDLIIIDDVQFFA